ncbi:hypothetical protein SAMN04487968_1195 [Nocardioides terrae]|uniref:Uncharacterized protein n=1 Tax=Nocardioides terrae TaxID=574651 RepID=A0A1I1NNF5_9ACTN|nr:hypothetical protein [Nocardioides terrae]SFC99214.1 hypothetical protein SAMN04487968_1195 [Nocardioides terrae]
MVARVAFAVDTWGLPREAEVRVCRIALHLFTGTAHEFETDIPLSHEADWPPAVRTAAHRLAAHSKHRRGENDSYRQTGIISAKDDDDWDAFVTFAPYAYDASVWGADSTLPLVQLSDEGTSLAVRLRPHEHIDLANSLGQERVIPASQWKRIRRRLLNERRRNP